MIHLGLILTLALAVEDPRVELVQLHLAQGPEATLARVEELLAAHPEMAGQLGLEYLRAHLLEARGGRPEETSLAFAEALSANEVLKPFSRFRLAQQQLELDHPEVAAGLAATLLASSPPRSLRPRTVGVLRLALARGGDCNRLIGLAIDRLPSAERRQLELSRALCDLRAGDVVTGTDRMAALLREKKGDEIAREAVDWVAASPSSLEAWEKATLVGLTFYQHREFTRAIRHLEGALHRGGHGRSHTALADELEVRYALARSHFWLEDYAVAARLFGELAERSLPREKARAMFNAGRSYELLGQWQAAANHFRLSHNAEPAGRWADAALFAALRLEWRTGNEATALELYQRLATRRSWRSTAARAALFLASSDLVRGRTDRLEPWLTLAEGAGAEVFFEVSYWRGRYLELEERPRDAVLSYLEILQRSAFHPLSRAAAQRLRQEPLAAAARAEGLRRARASSPEDLHAAWLLLGNGHPRGVTARQQLLQALRSDRGAAPYLSMAAVPVEDWPLWQASLREPEEQLLALGLWREGSAKIREHFPLSEPNLAFTGSRLLAEDGAVTLSLRQAEILLQRVPSRVPEQLLPPEFLRLLYPPAHGELIERQAMRFFVEPSLIRAVIREESRFDPDALSNAAARGLTQFVMPTARELSRELGMSRIRPQDLYDPPTAITLGAKYLSRLLERFDGARLPAVAAYNAGEPQARLWQRYCYGQEDEEYFTKVGFRETRDYLTKVLTSYEAYRGVYGSGS